MTNYTELIERLRTRAEKTLLADYAFPLLSAADAIEALVADLDMQAGSIEVVQAANQRLAAERDTLRTGLSTLLHQIEINDFVDSHGHSAKMLSAVLDAKKLLEVKNG